MLTKLKEEMGKSPSKELTIALLFIRDSLLITQKEVSESILTNEKFGLVLRLLDQLVDVKSENEFPVLIRQKD